MDKNIKDKVIVFTGADSGLGEEAARYLAEHYDNLLKSGFRRNTYKVADRNLYEERRKRFGYRYILDAIKEAIPSSKEGIRRIVF